MNIKKIEFKFQCVQFHAKRAEFYLDLSATLKNSPQHNLILCLERYALRYRSKPLAHLCRVWLERFQTHGHFSDVLHGTVPDTDISVIKIAEQQGDLANGLALLGENLMALQKIYSILFKSLMGLILLGILFLVYLGIYAWKVVPILEPIAVQFIPQDDLGALAKMVFFMAHGVRVYWAAFLFCVVVMIGTLVYSLRCYRGQFRTWLDDHVLPFQVYRDIQSAHLILMLAQLSKSNGSHLVRLPKILQTMIDLEISPWSRWQLEKILNLTLVMPTSKCEIFNTGIVNQKTYFRILDLSDYLEIEAMLEKVGGLILQFAPKDAERRAMQIRVIGMVGLMGVMLLLYVAVGDVINQIKLQSTMH